MEPFNPQTSGCIICGGMNPVGLHCRFLPAADDGVEAELTLDERWQGYATLAHGGIVAGLMDDAMWHAIYQRTARWMVTAEIRVRYHRPVMLGEMVRVRATIERLHGRLVDATATIADAEYGGGDGGGSLLAEAHGRFLPAPRDFIGFRHSPE